jgi:hypothetical protein
MKGVTAMSMIRKMIRNRAAWAAALLGASLLVSPVQAQTTLRVVAH